MGKRDKHGTYGHPSVHQIPEHRNFPTIAIDFQTIVHWYAHLYNSVVFTLVIAVCQRSIYTVELSKLDITVIFYINHSARGFTGLSNANIIFYTQVYGLTPSTIVARFKRISYYHRPHIIINFIRIMFEKSMFYII